MTVVSITSHPRFAQVREAHMSKAQLATVLGVSTKTIERYMRSGLPFTRLPNGHSRYLLSEVRLWLSEQRPTEEVS